MRVINLLGNRTIESTFSADYLELIVRESRHIDGGGHTCGTLDRLISDLGAYGAQYYLMLWLGTHSGGHPGGKGLRDQPRRAVARERVLQRVRLGGGVMAA